MVSVVSLLFKKFCYCLKGCVIVQNYFYLYFQLFLSVSKLHYIFFLSFLAFGFFGSVIDCFLFQFLFIFLLSDFFPRLLPFDFSFIAFRATLPKIVARPKRCPVHVCHNHLLFQDLFFPFFFFFFLLIF